VLGVNRVQSPTAGQRLNQPALSKILGRSLHLKKWQEPHPRLARLA
jgi:hypothetical protein